MSTEDKNEDKEEKKPIIVRNSTDLQRLKLEKLMKNPEKPILIPERPKERGMPNVPDFVRNVMGSSAGAGSGEFHVYRHLRRKEYARQKFMKERAEKEKLEDDYHLKLEENKRLAEERTAKKRKKRIKKKAKKNNRKKSKPTESKQSSSSSEQSEDSEIEDEVARENPDCSKILETEHDPESKSVEHQDSGVDSKKECGIQDNSSTEDKTT